MDMKVVYVITGVGSFNSLGSYICREIKRADENAYIIAVCAPSVAPALPEYVDQFFNCDLSDFIQTHNLFATIAELNPEIHRFIHCAGTNMMNWFPDVDFPALEEVMAVNCYSFLWATQKLLPSLREGSGTVLPIISMGAHKPFRTSLAYNISKAALKMAMEQLARELSLTDGLCIFGISPNELEGTPMTLENAEEIGRIRGWSPEEVAANRAQGEQTSPSALAEFIAYLLCNDSFHKHFNGVDLYYGD